ncbi:hypothetical protein JHK87_022106 [Glycine soja]|nr:hypothetical protein JHK87_022106 [Glycine soja]
MEEHLDMDKLESYFGGENTVGFNYEAYAKKMKEDNISMYDVFYSCCSSSPGFLSSEINESVQSGTDDSEDEASIDRTVFSNLEEDDDSTHMGRCLAPNMNPISRDKAFSILVYLLVHDEVSRCWRNYIMKSA